MLSTTNRLILHLGVASAILNPALIFAPLLVGGVVSTLGFSTGAAVTVVSVELIATALASFPALWWVTRVDWRKVAVIALLAVIAGNLSSAGCETLISLLVIRAITGLFGSCNRKKS